MSEVTGKVELYLEEAEGNVAWKASVRLPSTGLILYGWGDSPDAAFQALTDAVKEHA